MRPGEVHVPVAMRSLRPTVQVEEKPRGPVRPQAAMDRFEHADRAGDVLEHRSRDDDVDRLRLDELLGRHVADDELCMWSVMALPVLVAAYVDAQCVPGHAEAG